MNKYKAVVFDVDNTLIDRRKAFIRLCEYIINKYITVYPFEGTREELIKYMILIDENGYGGLGNFIPKLRKLWKVGISTQDYINDRNEVFASFSVPMTGLTEILEELKRRYKLGIITNGSSEVQRGKIAAVGITEYFDDIIVSGETEYAKPDPRIFHLACRNLMVEPKEMVYIGDYYPNDIVGARNANIMPIWITEDPDEHAEFEGIRIAKLTDLLQFL